MSEAGQGKRELVEVIKALRSDVQTAMQESTGEMLRLDVEAITLNLKTKISRISELEADGEVEFKILGLELGANASRDTKQQAEHTISLTLRPKIEEKRTSQYGGVTINGLD